MFNKIILTVVLSAIFSLLSACDWLETVDRHYPNYESLGKSDEPGNWIPSFIPRSAVEMRERHKVDTGAEVLTFHLGNIGDLSLSGVCAKVTPRDVELPPSGFLSVRWWPDSLFRDGTKKEEVDQYVFYRCEKQSFLAVKQTQLNGRYQVFYWRIRYILKDE
jgi:hypothetical protein